MDGSSHNRQYRLLNRLLGRLRGERNVLDKNISFSSTGMSENVGCGSSNEEDEKEAPAHPASTTSARVDYAQFAANVDLRYGGQYLTPEQLPEFCNQLHHLVEVIRNIQSYAKITGEYPSELERNLSRECDEVCALAGEARAALNTATQLCEQRRALRGLKDHLTKHLNVMREAETRELESSVRVSDRKLYKSWEALKDSTDPAAFDTLIDEVRGKQTALACLVRLIENRRANIGRSPPRPLPAPRDDEGAAPARVAPACTTWRPPGLPVVVQDDALSCLRERRGGRVYCTPCPIDSSETGASVRKRHEARRHFGGKRKRKEPRSVPLSGEPSHHTPHQVTLYIQNACGPIADERWGHGGSVTLGPEQPPRASVRDILFFTTD